MEIANIYPHDWNNRHKDAVVGIYYPNGVFEETDEVRGISFVLDHLLFIALTEKIAKLGGGKVRGFTNHGYSAFLLICKPEKILENLQCAENVLFGSGFDGNAYRDELGQWVEYRQRYTRSRPRSLDALYYAKRLPDSPLSKIYTAGICCLPSGDALTQWRNRYIRRDRAVVLGSGEGIAFQENVHEWKHGLPNYVADKVTLPNHIPWRRSQLVLSIPYDITVDNILTTEAVCRRLDPIVACAANRHGCTSYPVQYSPDFFSELHIHIQCPRGKEHQLIEDISQAIETVPTDISEAQTEKLRSRIRNHFYSEAADPIAWNRFAGYNAMSGNRHSLLRLLNDATYAQAISPDTIHQMLSVIRDKQISVFATAVR